jgi:hypothetical protein
MEVRLSAGSSDFAEEGRDLCLLCHQLAKEYGGAPHVYRDLDLDDLSFDRLCLTIGRAHEADERMQLPDGSIQPVWIVG